MAALYIIIQQAEEKIIKHMNIEERDTDPIFGVEGFNMQISNVEWVSRTCRIKSLWQLWSNFPNQGHKQTPRK